jgi:hypothetical protein
MDYFKRDRDRWLYGSNRNEGEDNLIISTFLLGSAIFTIAALILLYPKSPRILNNYIVISYILMWLYITIGSMIQRHYNKHADGIRLLKDEKCAEMFRIYNGFIFDLLEYYPTTTMGKWFFIITAPLYAHIYFGNLLIMTIYHLVIGLLKLILELLSAEVE